MVEGETSEVKRRKGTRRRRSEAPWQCEPEEGVRIRAAACDARFVAGAVTKTGERGEGGGDSLSRLELFLWANETMVDVRSRDGKEADELGQGAPRPTSPVNPPSSGVSSMRQADPDLDERRQISPRVDGPESRSASELGSPPTRGTATALARAHRTRGKFMLSTVHRPSYLRSYSYSLHPARELKSALESEDLVCGLEQNSNRTEHSNEEGAGPADAQMSRGKDRGASAKAGEEAKGAARQRTWRWRRAPTPGSSRAQRTPIGTRGKVQRTS